jgi:plastocyanin
MRRTVRLASIAAWLCALLALPTCSSGTHTAERSAGPAGSSERVVHVDGRAKEYNGSFLAFFPRDVSVHPGDTVRFKEEGQPHTVTMGTLVEQGLAKAAKDPVESWVPIPPDSLPGFFPPGPGDVHQNGAQPCFLASGRPPVDPDVPCPRTEQPPFDGTQTYYNSGNLPMGSAFEVKLSPSIRPGRYSYYCIIHGPDMSGTVTVVPPARAIPSAENVERQAKKQFRALADLLRTAADSARKGDTPVTGHLAGYGAAGLRTAQINEFFPPAVSAKVGEKVQWTFVGPHTLTFRPPERPHDYIRVDSDGSVHFDHQLLSPAGGPQPTPQSATSTSEVLGVDLKVTDGGSYDGSSFRSTGLVLSFPPTLLGYTLVFTKPGTYPFTCVLHPGMDGVVTVR